MFDLLNIVYKFVYTVKLYTTVLDLFLRYYAIVYWIKAICF
jgi:hypothetical protein